MVKRKVFLCLSIIFLMMGSSAIFGEENKDFSSREESIQKQIRDVDDEIVRNIKKCILKIKEEFRESENMEITAEEHDILADIALGTFDDIVKNDPELFLALISHLTTRKNLVKIMNEVGLFDENLHHKVLGNKGHQVSLFDIIFNIKEISRYFESNDISNNIDSNNKDLTIPFYYRFIYQSISQFFYSYIVDTAGRYKNTEIKANEERELLNEALKRTEIAIKALPEDFLYNEKAVTQIKAEIFDNIYYTEGEQFLSKVIERMNYPYSLGVRDTLEGYAEGLGITIPLNVAKALLRNLEQEEAFSTFNYMVKQGYLLDPIKDYLQLWLADIKGNSSIDVEEKSADISVEERTMFWKDQIFDELTYEFEVNGLDKFLDRAKELMKDGSIDAKPVVVEAVAGLIRKGSIKLQLVDRDDFERSVMDNEALNSYSSGEAISKAFEANLNEDSENNFIKVLDSLNLTSSEEVLIIFNAILDFEVTAVDLSLEEEGYVYEYEDKIFYCYGLPFSIVKSMLKNLSKEDALYVLDEMERYTIRFKSVSPKIRSWLNARENPCAKLFTE